MNIDALTRMHVFSRPDAAQAGFGRRAFDAAVRDGLVLRQRRRVFATAETVAHATRDERAAHALEIAALKRALSRENIAAAGSSAGIIHGLEFATPPPKRLVVCTPDPGVSGTCRDGYSLRPAALPADHVVRLYHAPVTSVARTLLDLAGELPFAHALATVDHARHDHHVSMEELDAVLAWGAGRPDIEAARAVLLRSDPRPESVLESISRAAMYIADVPIPELQAEICTPDGEFVARVDFLWEVPVIGEADGFGKFRIAGTRQLSLEAVKNHRARLQALVDLGFEVVVWDWAVANDPPVLRQRLFDAFERAEAKQAARRRRTRT